MSQMAALSAPGPAGPRMKGPLPSANGLMMPEMGMPRMSGMMGPSPGPYGPMQMQPGMMPNAPMMSQQMNSFMYGPGNPAMSKQMDPMSRFAGPNMMPMDPRGKAFPGSNGQMMMDFGPRMGGPGMMAPGMGPHGHMGMQPGMMPSGPMMSQQPMNHMHYGSC